VPVAVHSILFMCVCKKGTAIPVTGLGGPYICETLRLQHFLDSQLTDDSELVSLTCQLPFTTKKDTWNSFLLEAESTPGP
jgi:hypothetical protein